MTELIDSNQGDDEGNRQESLINLIVN